MTREQLVQMALDAGGRMYSSDEMDFFLPDLERFAALVAAAALAEPVQEPVAWMIYTLDGKSVCVTDNPADFTAEHRALPLYTRSNT